MDFKEEAFFSIALSSIPGMGAIRAKRIIDSTGSAKTAFENHTHYLQSKNRGNYSSTFDADIILKHTDKVYQQTIAKGIDIIAYTAPTYPWRLKECEDPPTLLYYKGSSSINKLRVVSIVGTRNMTAYGESFCNELITDLADFDSDILIVSGLAYGVDVLAHKKSILKGMDTIAVLAHGLDRIYPFSHRHIAKEIINKGALVSEYPLGAPPDRFHFVSRNRIIAGLSDVTVVIESAYKGGALITAQFANDYNRECFALPGRVTDSHSLGCNQLIKENRAGLIQSAQDIINNMQWKKEGNSPESENKQYTLFTEPLTAIEEVIVKSLKEKGNLTTDGLAILLNLPIHKTHSLLFELEMKGVISSIAGNSYTLN